MCRFCIFGEILSSQRRFYGRHPVANDCATKTNSCAGTAKMDAQGDAFVVVPKGLCEKLAGGSLQPK